MSSPSPVQDMPEDLSVKKCSVVILFQMFSFFFAILIAIRLQERQTSDETGSNSDRDARSETPQSVASAKAESISGESAKNVTFSCFCVMHNTCIKRSINQDFGERKNVQSPGSNMPSLLSSIIMNSQPAPASKNVLNLSPIHQRNTQ